MHHWPCFKSGVVSSDTAERMLEEGQDAFGLLDELEALVKEGRAQGYIYIYILSPHEAAKAVGSPPLPPIIFVP